MICFTVSKEDFRRMCHGARSVRVSAFGNYEKMHQVEHVMLHEYKDCVLCLQDESEPARCRIVKCKSIVSLFRKKQLKITFKFLYD